MSCPFCDVPCGNSWCPYTKEKGLFDIVNTDIWESTEVEFRMPTPEEIDEWMEKELNKEYVEPVVPVSPKMYEQLLKLLS
jgi:hypothetical protein